MTMHRPGVLVLMGGPDAERDVSVMSGTAVARALREAGRFEVFDEVIDRPTAAELSLLPGDVVFPVLHGSWGEGGSLQILLDAVGRPYVGSRPQPSFLAMDKLRTKAIARELDVDTPDAVELDPGQPCPLDPPIVIKPIDDGSSVDLRICRTPSEIEDARLTLHARRPRLMAERYIEGRELTVGIIADAALPVIEIRPAVEFYDYAAKYTRDDTRYAINPDDISPAVINTCQQMAMQTYEHLGCRDIARADFMLNDDGPWFLELNTMPGFTTHSLVPMAAKHVGLPMDELCTMLVERALQRGPDLAPASSISPSFR